MCCAAELPALAEMGGGRGPAPPLGALFPLRVGVDMTL